MNFWQMQGLLLSQDAALQRHCPLKGCLFCQRFTTTCMIQMPLKAPCFSPEPFFLGWELSCRNTCNFDFGPLSLTEISTATSTLASRTFGPRPSARDQKKCQLPNTALALRPIRVTSDIKNDGVSMFVAAGLEQSLGPSLKLSFPSSLDTQVLIMKTIHL